MFAIILTILVLELHIPHLENNTWEAFASGMGKLVPKLISFFFSFFILAIFWINHHHILHNVKSVDTKFLWLNTTFLFFASFFPFITAFIGDYPLNPYVVAMYPLNMSICAIVKGRLWKYLYVDTQLAPNKLTDIQKKKQVQRDWLAVRLNLASAGLAFDGCQLQLQLL
jgi:uncharacterized membrane protein